MAFSFNNRKVLVTGACSGLGKQIAISLVQSGAEVFALSISPDNLKALKEMYPAVKTITQDLTNWTETKSVLENLPPLDGLVNNAGIIPANLKLAVDCDVSELHMFVQTNLYSAINCTQVIAKKMIDNKKQGSIVNISSILAQGAYRGTLPYCISKAGLDMATKQFALELAAYNIRVNAVNPTLFMSDPVKLLVENLGDVSADSFVSRTPMGRLPKIEELVGPVLYLLSDQSSMVTGTTHIVDGGNLASLSA